MKYFLSSSSSPSNSTTEETINIIDQKSYQYDLQFLIPHQFYPKTEQLLSKTYSAIEHMSIHLRKLNKQDIESNIIEYTKPFIALAPAIKQYELPSSLCIVTNVIDAPPLQSNMDYLGFQRHLCSAPSIREAKERGFLSLGQLKSNISIAEPIIRKNELLIINLNVLENKLVSTGIENPLGLSITDLGQLARYAGLNPANKGIIIVSPEEENNVTAHANSVISWYYAEGLKDRSDKEATISANLQTYLVNIDSLDQAFEFLKDTATDMWWFKHPTLDHDLIACSYEDYLEVCSGEGEDKILQLMERG